MKSNITDNESVLIKGSYGYVQGYNGLAAADSENQVILAAEAAGSGSEAEFFETMLDGVEDSLKTLTANDDVSAGTTALEDTAYVTEKNLKAAVDRKIDAIIPDQQFRNRDARFDGHPCHNKR